MTKLKKKFSKKFQTFKNKLKRLRNIRINCVSVFDFDRFFNFNIKSHRVKKEGASIVL